LSRIFNGRKTGRAGQIIIPPNPAGKSFDNSGIAHLILNDGPTAAGCTEVFELLEFGLAQVTLVGHLESALVTFIDLARLGGIA
jgi:hypothetical protein